MINCLVRYKVSISLEEELPRYLILRLGNFCALDPQNQSKKKGKIARVKL